MGAIRNTAHDGTCKVQDCKRPYSAKGYCGLHYRRWLKHGDAGAVDTYRILGRTCSIEGCDRKHVANGLCGMHRLRYKNTGKVGPAHKMIGHHPGCVTRQGYRVLRRAGHPNSYKHGAILEHTLVMSEMLGRPLLKGETVHHKNGDRLDNRPENLELWSKWQPSGQRAVDKIKHAAELLKAYCKDAHLWSDELSDVRMAILAIHEPQENQCSTSSPFSRLPEGLGESGSGSPVK